MSAMRPSRGQDELQAGGMPLETGSVSVRPVQPLNPTQAFFNLDVLRSLQLHRSLAFGIFALAILLTAGYLAKSWNRYSAKSLVYVQPAPPRLMDNGPSQRWPYDSNTYESYIQQQIHNVTRPDVLIAAVKKIPGWQDGSETEQAAAARLDRAIEVVREGASYQVSITAKAGDAALAARMANAVAESFIESATRELRSGDTQRIALLREERERILKELAADRSEQGDLNKKLGIAAVAGNTPDPYDEQITSVRSELVKARTANDEAAARLTSLAKSGTSTAAMDAEADEIVSTDAGMVSMKTALNKRRSDLISQMANLTPNHPQYKQDADELAKINTSIDAITKELRDKASEHIQQRLKNDLERTSGVEAKLNAQLGQLTGAAGSATPRLQRSNELATDIVRLQNRFAIVDEQFRNLTMENNAPGAVYVASAATPPLNADHVKMYRNALIVLMLGLVLGLGAALMAHNLDPRIYVAKDVERILGFAPMAMLPDFQEVGTGVSEEYLLRLAAAVEHAYHEGALKSCIFTGVAPGAGATTVATRVTDMLQAMGRETVLVDASGMLPAESNGEPSGSTDLVAAPRGTRSTALLQQMADMTSANCIVVTDTAPLLVSGETEYLARFVDSAIVVIESGVTTRTQLRDLARTLQRLEVSAVGFVLNRVSLDKANSSFRDSVQAVEMHLRTQARSFARSAPRNPETVQRNPQPAHRDPQPPPPAERQPIAEVRVPQNQRRTDFAPEPIEEPADAFVRDLGAAVARSQERKAAKESSARPTSSGRPREDDPQPDGYPGRVVASETARAPDFSSARTAEPQPAYTAHRFITPEPSYEPPRSFEPSQPIVSGVSVEASAPTPRPAPTVQASSSPFVPMEPAEPHSESTPTRPAAPSMSAQIPRGRETKRTAPPATVSSRIEEGPIPHYVTPVPEAVRPKSSAPQPVTMEGRTNSSPSPSIPAQPPANPYMASAAQRAKPVIESATIPSKFNSAAPAGASGMFGKAPASPAPARPGIFSADSRPETHAAVVSSIPTPSQDFRISELPPSTSVIPAHRPAPQDPVAEEGDDLPYSAASRLGGLRNLLVSLGMKAVNAESEFPDRADGMEPTFERNPERAVYAEPISYSTARGVGETLPPDPTLVKAKPEFLPPKPVVETAERDKELPRPVPKRLRWDAPDDVETLPSWRGQYRKRR